MQQKQNQVSDPRYSYPPPPQQFYQQNQPVYIHPQYCQQQQNFQYPQLGNQYYYPNQPHIQQPILQAEYVTKVEPEKKPSPFSFEPGSNKELDDALKSIGNMYDDMFDSIENQRKKQKEEQEKFGTRNEEIYLGIPVQEWNPYSNNNNNKY